MNTYRVLSENNGNDFQEWRQPQLARVWGGSVLMICWWNLNVHNLLDIM